jgi:hypothetical protein
MFFDINIDNLCDPLEKIPKRKKPPLQLFLKAITRQHWFLVLTPTYMEEVQDSSSFPQIWGKLYTLSFVRSGSPEKAWDTCCIATFRNTICSCNIIPSWNHSEVSMGREAPGHTKQGETKKYLWRSSSCHCTLSFHRQRVLVTLQRILVIFILHQAVVTAGEASSRLGVPLSFTPISLQWFVSCYWWWVYILCFMFSPLRALILGSALLGVIFCLDSSPFFFLLMFPCRVFFLYIYIYL